MAKLKAEKTLPAGKAQGAYRWTIKYANGDEMDKYNADGTKNPWETEGKTWVNTKGASKIGLTDSKGKKAAELDVPDGAVIFQRRRSWDFGGGINYDNQYREVEVQVPEIAMALVENKTNGGMEWVECTYDDVLGRWIPPNNTPYKNVRIWAAHKIIKVIPVINYTSCWIIGWRRREADGSITQQIQCLYPDGKVDAFDEWGVVPWVREPQWSLAETLDVDDQASTIKRLAKKHRTSEAKMKQTLGW